MKSKAPKSPQELSRENPSPFLEKRAPNARTAARAPPGTAQARPASPRNASPAPRNEPRTASRRCRGRRARGRAADGAGMAAMPAGCAAKPEAPHPPSCQRAGPEGLRVASAAFINTPPPGLARGWAVRRRVRCYGRRARPEIRASSDARKNETAQTVWRGLWELQ